MSLAGLEAALPAGDRILLDTTALAAYLEAAEPAHPVARHVIDSFVAGGRNAAVVSTVTVMEILIRPLRAVPPRHHTLLDFLSHQANLSVVALDLQMAQDAAMLRAEHRLSPPDALIVGTGIACQVGHLVTNDLDWGRKLARLEGRIKVCLLQDHLPL